MRPVGRRAARAGIVSQGNEKTSVAHWDTQWGRAPRMRLPSSLNVSIRNVQRLLRPHVKPGARFLELGCAPGKILLWVAQVLKADVTGLDYSERGMEHARRLFAGLNVPGRLVHEDLFHHSLPAGEFDVVYSSGLIEHFEHPEEVVEIHVRLLRPGGQAILTVPNYGGFYGWALSRLNPANLKLHNLSIMNLATLRSLAFKADRVDEVQTYHFGRFAPWLVPLPATAPKWLTPLIHYPLNLLGLLQAFDWRPLCPLLVLQIRRD